MLYDQFVAFLIGVIYNDVTSVNQAMRFVDLPLDVNVVISGSAAIHRVYRSKITLLDLRTLHTFILCTSCVNIKQERYYPVKNCAKFPSSSRIDLYFDPIAQ